MELNVRDLSATLAELTIELDAAKVQKEFDKHYSELAKSLDLPGFRKGKVPRAVLKRRFGRELQAEVTRELASSLLEEALGTKKFRPIGEPSVEELSLQEGERFRMVVRIEHLPELNLRRHKGLAPPPAELEVSDEEIGKQLRLLQLREATRTEVERPAQTGDRVSGRFRLYVNDALDGESEELTRQFDLVVGEDHLFGGTRLDQKLAGHARGERFRIEGETPLAYPTEKYRGRRLALDVELDKIEQLEVPTLDDAFATEKFQTSLEELRERVRQQILDGKQREDRERRVEVLFQRLREENPFPLPETLLQTEAAREREQWDKQEVSESDRAELERTQPERVERRVRNALLLQKVIEVEKFTATDADIRQRYAAMGAMFGQEPNVIQQWYQKEPRLQRNLQDEILEAKAVEFLLGSTAPLILEV